MHAVELDQPTPRPVRRRWGNPTWHAGFDPWTTWKVGCQCISGGALVGGLGWALSFWFATAGLAFITFGALTAAFGIWAALGGLAVANEELRGHRFLVSQGVVARARVVGLHYDEMRADLIYEFCDAKGRKRKSRCSTRRGDEWFEDLRAGGEFDVLYSPRNSRHFVPYPIAIWEVTPT